ncbi:MAG: prolipoprotein diacylglyceryl transferase [Prevotella sp.]|uniref:prolipoprotein diacylglyceryl transferase n=1 Tax=Prevotella sp. TaxID=59823 RepID=UPI002A2E2BA4|nr:prolipoprotein diacylglyceryl transferase [Prevotella sp.]MDD7318450.1 prolipoprotein diacylglyceryl transferase [Prevotellaceae bacterium]MDY4020199.1 prolipoprotein diacylglyceryl transferase [Prevotella sp.]
MTDILAYITWNPDAEIFRIGGLAVRWYSMCWLVGVALAYFIVKKLYKEQNVKEGLFDPLLIYCFFGILIGARLGHCLFYDEEYFLSSPEHVAEIFVPVRFLPNGDWKYTGYEGLASHGGTIGLTLALIIYWFRVRKQGLGIWQILDNIAIATPVTACFIRLGNLVNSEIIGKVTDVPWAFIFERVDMSPRHPGQLYEAIAYALFFPIGWYFYRKYPGRVGTGFFFGLCLTLIFTFRFFIEYTKDIQVAKEAAMTINIGQQLSIPFVIIGLFCIWRSCKAVKN